MFCPNDFTPYMNFGFQIQLALQKLQMLSRSLSDCKSLLLNVMIQVSQFVSNSQLCL